MRSIQRNFLDLQKKRPNLSSLTNFIGTVRNRGFSKESIHYWFNKIVDKDDYLRRDKKLILDRIVSIAQSARGHHKSGVNRSQESPFGLVAVKVSSDQN